MLVKRMVEKRLAARATCGIAVPGHLAATPAIPHIRNVDAEFRVDRLVAKRNTGVGHAGQTGKSQSFQADIGAAGPIRRGGTAFARRAYGRIFTSGEGWESWSASIEHS